MDSAKVIKENVNNIDKDTFDDENNDYKKILFDDFKYYFEYSNDKDDTKNTNIESIESKQKETISYSCNKINQIISNAMNNTECAEENTYA